MHQFQCRCVVFEYVTWPAKIGHVAHKIWLIFQTYFNHKILFFDDTAMIFIAHNLAGIVLHITECKYCIPVLWYDLLSDMEYFVPTCPIFADPVTYQEFLSQLSANYQPRNSMWCQMEDGYCFLVVSKPKAVRKYQIKWTTALLPWWYPLLHRQWIRPWSGQCLAAKDWDTLIEHLQL